MAYQKKCYRSNPAKDGFVYESKMGTGNAKSCHQSRGKKRGVPVDTGFGAKGNNHRSKKNYPRNPFNR